MAQDIRWNKYRHKMRFSGIFFKKLLAAGNDSEDIAQDDEDKHQKAFLHIYVPSKEMEGYCRRVLHRKENTNQNRTNYKSLPHNAPRPLQKQHAKTLETAQIKKWWAI